MSTRCQIGFYRNKDAAKMDFEALIYKHNDGYPSGVLPLLFNFLRRFDEDRGIQDTEYCAARYLGALLAADRAWLEDCNRRNPEKTGAYSTNIGYGISRSFHGDLDYFYRVNAKEKTVEVHRLIRDGRTKTDAIEVFALEEMSSNGAVQDAIDTAVKKWI